MGNTNSRLKGHNFSIKRIDPYPQSLSAEDFKMIEDERNRALADKKRFAVRLSEVEETISKKNDAIKILEDQLKEMQTLVSRSKAENKMLVFDLELSKQANQLTLLEVNESKREAEMLRNQFLTFMRSYQELPSHSTLTSKSSPMISTIETLVMNGKEDVVVLKKTIHDLLIQLQEKETVKSNLSEQLKKLTDEFSKFQKEWLALDIKLGSRLTLRSDQDTQSHNISKSLPSSNSQDSLASTGSSILQVQS